MRCIQIVFRLGLFIVCYLYSSGFVGGNVVFAQSTAGNAVYQFLKLPYSAKATSLGGLNISSIGNDLGLAMMQPALLSTDMNGEFQLSVKPYFAGIQQYDLNGANKLKSDWVIGWGVHYMNYGSILQTDVLGNEYGSIKPNEYAIQVGIAKTYLESFHFGTQIKFIQSNYGQYISNGIAMDVGVRYLSPYGSSQWSILLQNVGTQLKYFQVKEELPLNLILGWSKKLDNAPLQFSVTAERLSVWNDNYYDLDFYNKEGYKKPGSLQNLFNHLVLGSQLYFGQSFEIDLGYHFARRFELNLPNQPNSLNGLSAGFGFPYKRVQFQYGTGFFQKNSYHHFTLQYALQQRD
jgi:hypothetical protein